MRSDNYDNLLTFKTQNQRSDNWSGEKMTKEGSFEKLFKTIFRVVVFLAIPLTTAFIMTGAAFEKSKFIPALIVLALTCILLIIGAIKSRECVNLAIIVCVLVFLALVRSVLAYTWSSKTSDYLINSLDNEQHIFSGFVSDRDASSSGGMYINIESVDEITLNKPITVYTVNRSGHYYSQGEFLTLSAKIRKPVSYSEDFDLVSFLESRGVMCELYQVSEINADHTKAKNNLGSVIRGFVYTNALKMINYIGEKPLFDRGTALAKALLWGDKSGFSDEELKDFSISGMTHLLCVSGLHFSIVLCGLSVLIRLLIRKRIPLTESESVETASTFLSESKPVNNVAAKPSTKDASLFAPLMKRPRFTEGLKEKPIEREKYTPVTKTRIFSRKKLIASQKKSRKLLYVRALAGFPESEIRRANTGIKDSISLPFSTVKALPFRFSAKVSTWSAKSTATNSLV